MMTDERLAELGKLQELFRCDQHSSTACEVELQDALRECLKGIEELQAENRELSIALDAIRDAVLHERFQLGEAGMDSDKINAVLGIIDDHDPRQLPNVEDVDE